MLAEYDCAIVGCGPVGATLANLLGAGRARVLVLDRAVSVFAQPRAASFDGEAMRVFQTIGLADAILPSTEAAGSIVHVNAEGALLLRLARPPGIGPEGWAAAYRCHQPAAEAVLRDGLARFATVRTRFGADVIAVAEQDGGVVIRFADAATGRVEQTTARCVVGCDGARSTVRRCMNVPMHDLRSHERWIVLDMVLEGGAADIRHPGAAHAGPRDAVQLCDPRRPATFVPMPGRRYRWEFMLLPDDDPHAIATPAQVWRLLEPWNVRPHHARIERAVVYTFHSALAARWRRGRMLLAGDAAHQMPPFLGQGMCSGLRDAMNLAWKLLAVLGGASAALLDSYETERSAHVGEYIALAVRLGAIIQATDAAAAQHRDAALLANPTAMQIIAPRLGPGLHGDAKLPAGMRAEQPFLADGTRLDDRAGYRFALLADAATLAALPAEDRRRLDRGAVAILPADGDAAAWLARLGTRAVMLRPDRAILGVAESRAELSALIDGATLTRFSPASRPKPRPRRPAPGA